MLPCIQLHTAVLRLAMTPLTGLSLGVATDMLQGWRGMPVGLHQYQAMLHTG